MLNLSAYHQPKSLPEALALLGSSGRALRPLAGGTDLVPALTKGETEPLGLVDLSRIPELRGISRVDNQIRIGSLSTFGEIENSPLLLAVPLLREAAAAVGSPQIRSQGTIGGNIANASPAADTVTALAALDAVARLESAAGSRSVQVSELLCGVGQTKLLPGEVIKEILFQVPPQGSRSGFVKLGRRKALAIARMNLALVITFEAGRISRARVALGAVGPNPSRRPALELVLLGQEPSRTLIDEFAMAASKEVGQMLGTRPSVSYKREAVKGIARDLLQRLFFGAGQVVG